MHIFRGRGDVFGKAARYVSANHPHPHTTIGLADATGIASSTANHRLDRDRRSDLNVLHAFADASDDSRNLMPRHARIFNLRKLAREFATIIRHVPAANTRRAHGDNHFIRPRLGRFPFPNPHLVRSIHNRSTHSSILQGLVISSRLERSRERSEAQSNGGVERLLRCSPSPKSLFRSPRTLAPYSKQQCRIKLTRLAP